MKRNPKDLYIEELKADFRKFMFLIWKHINLPDPTPLQYDIASYLQHGPNKVCIEAFRGVGKSFITSAYVAWLLFRDPQLKILVVSASKNRADNFTTFTLSLIQSVPILKHLAPRADQRASRVEFDVAPAIPDQSPSVRSVGITSQIAGSRADVIVSDDVEVPNNSMTMDMREKLLERIKEYSAVLKPLPGSKIIYLGTPQTEDSIYNKLPETFDIRIWPARVPTKSEAEKYGGKLAPYITAMLGVLPAGSPTDPQRFNEFDLAAREAEYGKAGFSLQFMLNTQLSDIEKYPLKIKDLIVMGTQVDRSPMVVEWMPDKDKVHRDLPNLAMHGDRFYAPAGWSNEWSDYTGSVMSIDPSGRGKDETGYAVVKMLNGFLYVRRAGGLQGGYDNDTLTQLAQIAKEEKVNYIVIEANFGDGMFTQLFKPVLSKVHPCTIEEVKHSIQKERRIIDTLEPVMARHKLVFDKEVISHDLKSTEKYATDIRHYKTLIYQMTRICYDRGALKFDDRLDALAIAVAYWSDKMAQDAEQGLKNERDRLFEEDMRRHLELLEGREKRGNRWFRLP